MDFQLILVSHNTCQDDDDPEMIRSAACSTGTEIELTAASIKLNRMAGSWAPQHFSCYRSSTTAGNRSGNTSCTG